MNIPRHRGASDRSGLGTDSAGEHRPTPAWRANDRSRYWRSGRGASMTPAWGASDQFRPGDPAQPGCGGKSAQPSLETDSGQPSLGCRPSRVWSISGRTRLGPGSPFFPVFPYCSLIYCYFFSLNAPINHQPWVPGVTTPTLCKFKTTT